MKHFLSLALVLALFASCEKHKEIAYNLVQTSNGLEYDERIELTAESSFKLPLDNQTGFYQGSVAYTELNGQRLYSFVNRLTNAIYAYDLDKKELVIKMELPVDGPNGVGQLSISDHVMKPNGNFLLYNVNTGILHEIDQKGTTVKKYLLFDHKGELGSTLPNPSSTRKMVLVGDDLYLPGEILFRKKAYTDVNSMLKVNLVSGESNYQLKYPDAYDLGHWGAIFKFQPSMAYNENKQSFMVNFPADPKLYEIDEKGDVLNASYVGSKFIEKFAPMTSDTRYGVRMNPNARDMRSYEYSLTTSDYSSIVYDKYNQVYYRYVANRPSKERFQEGDKSPEYSIIILDESLVKQGEIRLNKRKYYASMSVVTPEGIIIPRLDLYGQNENELVFDVFTLKSKNDALAAN